MAGCFGGQGLPLVQFGDFFHTFFMFSSMFKAIFQRFSDSNPFKSRLSPGDAGEHRERQDGGLNGPHGAGRPWAEQLLELDSNQKVS